MARALHVESAKSNRLAFAPLHGKVWSSPSCRQYSFHIKTDQHQQKLRHRNYEKNPKKNLTKRGPNSRAVFAYFHPVMLTCCSIRCWCDRSNFWPAHHWHALLHRGHRLVLKKLSWSLGNMASSIIGSIKPPIKQVRNHHIASVCNSPSCCSSLSFTTSSSNLWGSWMFAYSSLVKCFWIRYIASRITRNTEVARRAPLAKNGIETLSNDDCDILLYLPYCTAFRINFFSNRIMRLGKIVAPKHGFYPGSCYIKEYWNKKDNLKGSRQINHNCKPNDETPNFILVTLIFCCFECCFRSEEKYFFC